MGKHKRIRLNHQLSALTELRDIQAAMYVDTHEEYDRGLHNGIELVIALLSDREPNYILAKEIPHDEKA